MKKIIILFMLLISSFAVQAQKKDLIGSWVLQNSPITELKVLTFYNNVSCGMFFDDTKNGVADNLSGAYSYNKYKNTITINLDSIGRKVMQVTWTGSNRVRFTAKNTVFSFARSNSREDKFSKMFEKNKK